MVAPIDLGAVLQRIPELGQWVQTHPYLVGGVCAGMPLAMLTVGAILKRRAGPKTAMDAYGSASWASRREIRRAGLFEPRGVILGQWQEHYLCDDREHHILLVAPSRSGKGVGTIIPTLLTWRESVLVLDPKDGENYDVTARWRSTVSRVYAFAPTRAHGTRLNVLDSIRLRTGDELGDTTVIAQSLVAPEKLRRESTTGLHFRELAAMLLTASILHVLYTAPRKSLAGVWAFLTQQDKLADALQTMRTTRHLSQGVHQAIATVTQAIQNISGDRELSSVWTTAIRPLALYNDPQIARNTDESDVDLEDLVYGPAPVSLYLIAPSPMALERLHPVYRVILDVASERWMAHKVRTWTQRCLIVGDELPWYGYSRAMDKGIAQQASYGIRSLLVAQDLEQLWEAYGEHTALWGNTGIKIFHEPDNDLTARRISENLLGVATVETPVPQQSPVLGMRRSVSMGHHTRPLLTVDEVMSLGPDAEIIKVKGMRHPILAQKFDYREDRFLRDRAA